MLHLAIIKIIRKYKKIQMIKMIIYSFVILSLMPHLKTAAVVKFYLPFAFDCAVSGIIVKATDSGFNETDLLSCDADALVCADAATSPDEEVIGIEENSV